MPIGISRADEPIYDIDIPSMNAAEALNRLAEQTGAVMLFSYDLASVKRANTVRGRYTLLNGLELLLQDTGLSGGLSDKRVVIIAEEGSMKGENGNKRGWFAGLVAVVAGLGATDSQADQAVETKADPTALNEIIVTAQRREERLQEVPISIVAVTADELRKRNITSIDRLDSAVSGLSIQSNSPTRRIAIRGVNNVFGNSSLIGMYLDEALVSSVIAYTQLDINTNDLERVEVLRGPQGTLYGDGALGGTIRFITREPNLSAFGADFNVVGEFIEDGEPAQHLETTINMPLVHDRLGLRISGTYDHGGGWVDQPAIGKSDINGRDRKEVRVKGLWEATPEFSVNAMAVIHRNKQGLGAGEDSDGNYEQAFGAPTSPSLDDDYDLGNLTLDYSLSSFRLLSTTTYLGYRRDSRNEGGRIPLPLGLTSPDLHIYLLSSLVTNYSMSEELRLTSANPGPLEWTIGGFYRHLRTRNKGSSAYVGLPSTPGTLPGAPFPLDFEQEFLSDSWAAFGDASYELTKRFTAGVGLRYFSDDLEDVATGLKEQFHSLNPRVYGSFKLNESLNVYASAAKGFRSGGLNSPTSPQISYDPESVWSYELGAKWAPTNSALSLDAAVFYSDYTDFQIFAVPTGQIFAFGSNAGDVEIKGVELTTSWRPSAQWELSLNGSYVKSRFDKIVVTPATAPHVVGDPVDMFPEYIFVVSAQRNFKLGGKDGFARIDYNEHDRETYGSLNGPAPERYGESDLINMLDFNVGLAWSQRLSVNFLATNLLDDRGRTDPFSVEGAAARARPRAYGIQFELRID